MSPRLGSRWRANQEILRQDDHNHLLPSREIEQNNGAAEGGRENRTWIVQNVWLRSSGISIPPQDEKHRFPGGVGTHSGFWAHKIRKANFLHNKIRRSVRFALSIGKKGKTWAPDLEVDGGPTRKTYGRMTTTNDLDSHLLYPMLWRTRNRNGPEKPTAKSANNLRARIMRN